MPDKNLDIFRMGVGEASRDGEATLILDELLSAPSREGLTLAKPNFYIGNRTPELQKTGDSNPWDDSVVGVALITITEVSDRIQKLQLILRGRLSAERIGAETSPVLKKHNEEERKDAQEQLATLERIINSFRGRVLIDIGPAEYSAGYELACRLGVKAYIGVELFHANALYATLQEITHRAGEDAPLEPAIPFAVVQEDMTVFLKRLQPGSVCILASGIDENVITSTEQRQQITTELSRVLHPEGACISCFSVFSFTDSEFEVFDPAGRKVEPSYSERHRGVYFIRKISRSTS